MMLQKFQLLIKKYPILRGMISYSIIWPTSCLIQQTFEGKRWGKQILLGFYETHYCILSENYDWWRALRFSIYGSMFVAPTIYGWFKVSSLK